MLMNLLNLHKNTSEPILDLDVDHGIEQAPKKASAYGDNLGCDNPE